MNTTRRTLCRRAGKAALLLLSIVALGLFLTGCHGHGHHFHHGPHGRQVVPETTVVVAHGYHAPGPHHSYGRRDCPSHHR
jgi:hypothetical protein